MSNDSPAVHNPTFHVSTIDISLAKGSRKTIGSIILKKNDESLKNIRETICAGGVYHEEFNPPLALNPNDHISLLANCNWPSMARKRVADILIDIDLRDVECMRDEQSIRLYRKKERKIEVLVTGRESIHDRVSTYVEPEMLATTSLNIQRVGTSVEPELLATTSSIIQSCSQFRLLVIGNSGVGKSSLIRKVFGVENIHVSENARGTADIDREFVSTTNHRFVVHDSLGFESGDERNIETVKEFVSRRMAMPQLQDQLHAIWLCLETPYSGGRLLETGAEKFLQRRHEILGNVPLVVVLTKADVLDEQLELDLPENVTFKDFKSMYMNEHCIKPLHNEAGNDITHVAISVEEGYSESLANLVQATLQNMDKYHVDEAPRVLASIAQRVSIKEKIDVSIAIGRKKYWKTLMKSAVFRGHTLEKCLQVIHKDIITVWNFDDPDMCLMGDNITTALLRTDNLDPLDGPSTMASFGSLLASGLELVKGLAASGEPTMAVAAPIAGMTISLLKTGYETYQGAKKDVKFLMAFIVDLICVMQAIFLVASGSRVTPQTVVLALQAYETPRKVVHLMVDDFDARQGIFGGRDCVLDKVEALIWRHSIPDHDIEELRRRIGQVLP